MALSVQDESLHSTGVPCEVCVQWTPPVKVGVYLIPYCNNASLNHVPLTHVIVHNDHSSNTV